MSSFRRWLAGLTDSVLELRHALSRKQKQSRRARLALEALEDRAVPAALIAPGTEADYVRELYVEVLGRKGNLDGGDVLDAILAHPALPRFLARKLLVFFACPDPGPEVVDEAIKVLRALGTLTIEPTSYDLGTYRFHRTGDEI